MSISVIVSIAIGLLLLGLALKAVKHAVSLAFTLLILGGIVAAVLLFGIGG